MTKTNVEDKSQDQFASPSNIDLITFKVFLKTQECGLVPLAPVVSNIIQDKKAHSDLQIVDYSDDSSPVHGMCQSKNISITTFL